MATAMIMIENVEPFGRIRREVASMVDSYLEKTSEHFQWLDEVLEEAKRAFEAPEVELLPKTPSEKRKQGRTKRGSVQKRGSSNKRQSSTGSRTRLSYRKARAAILDMGGDLGAESDDQADGDEDTNVESMAIQLPPAIFEEAIEEEHENAEDQPANEVHEMQDQDEHMVTAEDIDIQQDEVAHTAEESAPVKAPATESAVEIKQGQPLVNSLAVEAEQKAFHTPEPANRKVNAMTTLPKSLLPVPTSSIVKEKSSTPSVLTPRVTPTHPINRCLTPQKSAVKQSSTETRDRLNQQLADATAKREDLLKQKIEEQKKKREERALKVAQQRLLQKAKDDEFKRKIEEKYLTPSAVDVEEKRKMRPRYPDSGSKKPDNERAQVMEKAKDKERLQREREEVQRQKQADLERAQQKAQPIVPSVPNQAKYEADPSRPQTSTQPKNPVAFHQPIDTSTAKLVVGKPKVSRETYIVAEPAPAASANSSGNAESYDMTPLRKMKPATASNYDISDLRSSDETDDEEHPRKKIPAWAIGGQLKMSLTQQYYNPPDLDELFGVVQTPELAKMFKFHRKRFFKRTSSAKWDSPIHPHAAK